MRANNCRNGCKRLHINDYKYYTFMKHCLLFFFLSLPVLATWAAPVTRRQAYAQAENFFAAHGITLKAGAKAFSAPQASTADGTTAAYYVFNAGGDKGFAIVSGDDRTEPVLGYALHGSVSEDNMPDNMRWWLGEYARQIKYIQDNDISATAATGSGSDRKHIPEMITTKWDQTEPYNNACPKVGGSYESVTGCVATAMAQVLYYEYQRHASTITRSITADIPAYTCKTRWNSIETNVAAVAKGTPIDWENMLLQYDDDATDKQKAAVANLMLWCGAAVQMNYGPASSNGSSAYNTKVASALSDFFGFDASVRHVNRDASYTNRQWNDVVYNELANGRVVIYGGQSQSSGHAFVINGYDKNNFFYVNWGWGGAGDGAYLLSVLSPDHSGTGAGIIGSGYNRNQDIIIYAEPDHGGTPAVQASAMNFTRTGNTLSYCIQNSGTETTSFDYGFGTVDGNGIVTGRGRTWTARLPAGTYSSQPVTFDLSTLPDGTYDVVPIAIPSEGSATLYQSLWPAGHSVHCTVAKGKVTIDDTGTPQLTATIATSDKPTAGKIVTVTASLDNSGDGDYEGVLYLYASTTGEQDGTVVATAPAGVIAGGTGELTFDWIPLAEGSYTLWISNRENGGVMLASTTVNVEKGNGRHELTLKSMDVNNATGTPTTDADGRTVTSITGSDITGSYTAILNQEIAASTHFTTFLQKYNEQTGQYESYNNIRSLSYSTSQTTLPAGYSLTIDFSFNNLPDGKYIVRPEVGTVHATTYYYMQPELWYDDSHAYVIGSTTGIASPSLDSSNAVNVYNLQGVKVATISMDKISTLPHGIYIVNGKKVVVK